MKRILVIGPSGSGKSTLSTTLGKKLGIEVLHLDRFYWSSGWIKPLPDAWTQTVAKLLTGDRWIIDGNYSGTLEQRIEACDTIVFLDMRMATCLWRVFKRRLLYRQQTRPDMADGCPEKLDLEFITWVMGYSSKTRPKVLKLINENESTKQIVWLRSRKEVTKFLQAVA